MSSVSFQICFFPQQNHFRLFTGINGGRITDLVSFRQFARDVDSLKQDANSITIGDVVIDNPDEVMRIYLKHVLNTTRQLKKEQKRANS